MKINNISIILAVVGFFCICSNTTYTEEVVISKMILLVLSCLCIVRVFGRDMSGCKDFVLGSEYTETLPEVTIASSEILSLSDEAHKQFCKGNYRLCIDYYIKAIDDGADEDVVDENIWFAFKKSFAEDRDEDYVKNYFEWFPQGAYHAEAKALLIGHYS